MSKGGATNTVLTTELLADLREKAKAATPGPWAWEGGMLKATSLPLGGYGSEVVLYPNNVVFPTETPGAAMGSVGNTAEARKEQSAAFMAAANPAVVLALLDRLEEAGAQVRRGGTITKKLQLAHEEIQDVLDTGIMEGELLDAVYAARTAIELAQKRLRTDGMPL